MRFLYSRLILLFMSALFFIVAGAKFASADVIDIPIPWLPLSTALILVVVVISIIGIVCLYWQQKTMIQKEDPNEKINALVQNMQKLQDILTAHIKAVEDQKNNDPSLDIPSFNEPPLDIPSPDDSNSSSFVLEKIEDLSESFLTFKKNLDEKDAEIKRLKSGYDAEIFRRFLSRFIRVDQEINDLIKEPGDLSNLQIFFEDALDECGVEKFFPELNTDYRKAYGVADRPGVVDTDDPEKHFLIAEVETNGYKLTASNNESDVIVKAKVKIFEYKKERT